VVLASNRRRQFLAGGGFFPRHMAKGQPARLLSTRRGDSVKLFVVEWRNDRYRIRKRNVSIKDGRPCFGVAIALQPRWFTTMREALAFVPSKEQPEPGRAPNG
jgi:hypothetical protein